MFFVARIGTDELPGSMTVEGGTRTTLEELSQPFLNMHF